MLGLIVDPIEHAVFKGDEIARRGRQIRQACIEQFGNRVLQVERHQRIAQHVKGSVQRHGERHRHVVGKARNHRHHPGGGHRDPPARQPIAMVVQHDFQSGHQCAVILQRFTHAHHDHVGDHAVIGLEMFAQKMLGMPELRQDLARGEIA
jgi:hypothetical protein